MKSLDESMPHLAIEIVCDGLTNDREQSERLCARMRMHWLNNPGFRHSFRRKDHRAVANMWLNHWIKSELKSGEFLIAIRGIKSTDFDESQKNNKPSQLL